MIKSIFYVATITMNILQKRTTINLATTTSIIVPGSTNKIMSLFSNSNDIVIQWERIKCISDDLILVEI